MDSKYGNRAVTVVDLLDRVLDKGIVIDPWVVISLVGVDLLTVETKVVIAEFKTYLSYGNEIRLTSVA